MRNGVENANESSHLMVGSLKGRCRALDDAVRELLLSLTAVPPMPNQHFVQSVDIALIHRQTLENTACSIHLYQASSGCPRSGRNVQPSHAASHDLERTSALTIIHMTGVSQRRRAEDNRRELLASASQVCAPRGRHECLLAINHMARLKHLLAEHDPAQILHHAQAAHVKSQVTSCRKEHCRPTNKKYNSHTRESSSIKSQRSIYKMGHYLPGCMLSLLGITTLTFKHARPRSLSQYFLQLLHSPSAMSESILVTCPS